ncbi:hypothetical protein HRG_005848 [Hirsutella rhossiliensis]|uniref:Uncharacterized protein n=1 Tax=Hirsutella rhossiliensis TaxID=111463 RepID=A0A9P8MW51_9HYPO|nr:uncharacterized protein HRG_05848 [Hirsutella rhossiliensis]KAH0963338.1 hypothetical protein HRG_05848 [Hirsutella rhossiliensis]
MRPFLLVAPLAALFGTAVAAPSGGNDAAGAAQTESETNVPTESRYSAFASFGQQLEDALVQDIVNLWNSGKTAEDVRQVRAAASPYALGINSLGDVGAILSRLGLGDLISKRSEAGDANPLLGLLGGGEATKNGSNVAGGKLDLKDLLKSTGGKPDVKALLGKLQESLKKSGVKDGGRKLGNLVATMFPVTSLVGKLGLGTLSPLTVTVDALLLALLGIGPTVGRLLFNLGLIGMKEPAKMMMMM